MMDYTYYSKNTLYVYHIVRYLSYVSFLLLIIILLKSSVCK
jgi:hypothetical protein